VRKEFFQILTEKLFTIDYGMFIPKNVKTHFPYSFLKGSKILMA